MVFKTAPKVTKHLDYFYNNFFVKKFKKSPNLVPLALATLKKSFAILVTVRAGTSPKPPSPTKDTDVVTPTDVPKEKGPFYGFDGAEDGEGVNAEVNFFTAFLYSLSLITTVGSKTFKTFQNLIAIT